MSISKSAVAFYFSAFILSSSALAGPEWIEQGDAGGKLDTAQRTTGTGNLTSIAGTLGTSALEGDDLEDMYLITITSPLIFQLSIDAEFDAQLFLFNVTLANEAFGLLGNNDTALGNDPVITSVATDGTGAQVLNPGVYAIAISGIGRDPISMNGLIFNFLNQTEISGPDGPGGLNPHTGWAGIGEKGGYKIDMIGVSFYDLPEPGSIALLGLALGVARRRRKH